MLRYETGMKPVRLRAWFHTTRKKYRAIYIYIYIYIHRSHFGSDQIRTGRAKLPKQTTMADSKMEEEGAMELLGNLDFFAGETRKERKINNRET